MAGIDGTIPFSEPEDGTLVVEDGGANSITIIFTQGVVQWTREGAPWVEARQRNKHRSTPVARRTGDGNITGTFSFLVASYKGDSNVQPYEAMTFTGNASGWTTVAAGDRKALKFTLTRNSTSAGGGSQSIAFNYVIPDQVQIGDQDMIDLSTVTFTDLEEDPTIT